MNAQLCKSALSRAWRSYIDLCERLNFGALEDVHFRSGEPIGTITSLKTIAFGTRKDNGPSARAGDPDGVLTESWQDVIALVGSVPELHVRRFEVAHGNPVKLHIEDRVVVSTLS